MKVARYLLTVRHDNGVVNIETAASSELAAIQTVMNAERCPRRSITAVKEREVIYNSVGRAFGKRTN